MKKNLLVAAIAAFVAQGAFAVQDIDDSNTIVVVVAEESVTSGDIDSNGNVIIKDVSPDAFRVANETGFTIGNGTSKYVRYDLVNGTFVDSMETMLTVSGATTSISQGGDAGDAFVIFEVAATTDVTNIEQVYLDAAYAISADGDVLSISYALYNDAPDAVSQATALSSAEGDIAKVGTGATGIFVAPLDLVATVASEFKAFETSNGGAVSTTLGTVGSIDTSLSVLGNTVNPDGSTTVAADIVTATQSVAVTGDFSFGSWSLATDATCASLGSGTLTLNTAKNLATIDYADINTGSEFLCVQLDGSEVANKSAYTASLSVDLLEDDFGSVKYDTTAIEIPYLTTFSSYNQRIYLVNNSATEAAYSTTFVSENGVTATPSSSSTGLIPANGMIALKATDLVTLDGKTRTAATIEVEAVGGTITATMQTIANGGTDTVVLTSQNKVDTLP